ncbi:hypothetical protein H5410_003846 [Solanum commersonii]|uniref:Uncharacterized protein n=1 Tax=Solanum commersonii TaxID=4109 RepID=A0A9J6B638_SOLCO|nr:hypothetical protein H5410_003846 [Solanum commersonii]
MSVHNVTDGNEGREPLAMQAGSARGPSHRKPPLVCDHCHMKGHTKSQCWKIIGYPGDKGKKKQGGFRGQPFANANNVVGSGAMNTEHVLVARCSFNKEDRCPRDLVMQLIANDHISLKNNTKQLVNLLTKDAEEQHANMAGTITCLLSGVPCRKWIVDYGATHHISSSLSLLEQGCASPTDDSNIEDVVDLRERRKALRRFKSISGKNSVDYSFEELLVDGVASSNCRMLVEELSSSP